MHPKVQAGLVAGAVTTILVWAVSTFTGVDITSTVAASITTLLTVLVAYLTPAPAAE